jgi:TPP-dependent pyruvate/acetoin dehydrogenase alpha subunit
MASLRQKYRQIHKRMLRIRMVEETIARRYPEQQMRCPTHLSIGQEGIAAVVGEELRDDDFAVSTHRCHAHYLGKGGDLKAMIAELHGKVSGCSRGKGGSMHLIDQSVGFMGSTAIVGNTIPVGVGLGLSIALKGGDQVSCVYLGDGAVEEGVFYESVNFAVLRKLPVLFICENNLYSVYSPLSVRQPKGRAIHRMVEAMGIESEHGDGNNCIALYHQIKAAVQSIRDGNGPYFLELDTYRWLEHCGPYYDNHIGYRTEEEYLEWKKRDPVTHMEEHLLAEGVLTEEETRLLREELEAEIEEAFDFAEASPFPAQDEAWQHLYKTPIR